MSPSNSPVPAATHALSASSRMAMKRAHLHFLHGTSGGGQVCLSREAPELKAGWEDTLVWQMRAADSPALLDAMYVGMNAFRFRRGADCLFRVGHMWMDFDFRTPDAAGVRLPYAHLDEEAVVHMLLAAFEACGIPMPSFFTASGNGLHAVWICDRLQASAQRKVAKAMNSLYGPVLRPDGTCPVRRRRDAVRDRHEARMLPLWQLARDLGLDRGARDAARVLRLWGSVNQKNGTVCRMAWPSSIGDVVRHEFNVLSDAVMPLTRHELKAILDERAAWREANAEAAAAYAAKKRRVPVSRWARIAADLLRLCEIRGGVFPKTRHLWIFLTANARAHAYGGDKTEWAGELGAMVGLTEASALSCLGTLDKRAQRHQAGEKEEYGGKPCSPLYHYSAARMVDDLSITDAEGELMSVLVPGGSVDRTNAERQADKRERDGCTKRSDQVAARIEDGRRAIAMKAEGKTMAQICTAIPGRGETSLRKAMREAAEASVETVVATTETVTDSNARGVHVPSRDIGPLASPAPARTPSARSELADPVSSPRLYDRPRVRRVHNDLTTYHYGPDTGLIVTRGPLGYWIALTLDGQSAEVPADFLANRKAAKAARQARPTASASVARRSSARTAIARPTASRAPSLTADEYRRISQGS
ncbi:hypothetical protein FV226_26690 [Methylobacterium sp. WL12]|uniref:hypothetical protein n=1 Tax=Methylobacterium sp. WL12 TaxID=2603890 RepID=UPI0011CA10FE|nr:hypothetical protein [Methylobacterium sp. WL12]TXM64283.1 hypothetical protein FV226_26690 [Methylobacterium sp. WL12]